MNKSRENGSVEHQLEGDSVFIPTTQQQLNEMHSSSKFGNSTLNDRESAATKDQKPVSNGDENFQPSYGQIWQDVDGDYSSDDENDPDTVDGTILNKIRVIVRVRPLI